MARDIFFVMELPLDQIRQILDCPSLHLHMRDDWGSANTEHRNLIRQFIAERLQSSELHHSISHCRQMGMIAVSNQNIGVDVEESARVKETIIRRMSTDQEVQAAPDFACLWAAKEASFKALMNYKQPMVVSRLEIGEWKSVGSQIETFKLLNNHEFIAPLGQGVVIKGPSHVIAIFVFPA